MSKNEEKVKKKEESTESTEEKEVSDPDKETIESVSTKSVSKNEKKVKEIKPEFPSAASKQKQDKTKKEKKDLTKSKSSRMVILFRSAEQMDKIFPEWIHKSFVGGKYVPTDMNQPMELPIRKTPVIAYDSDPPLTEMGIRVSQLIGKAFAENGIVLSAIYSSPSLRCIQTAQNIIKSQLFDLKICIEPAFYDFAGTKGKQNKDKTKKEKKDLTKSKNSRMVILFRSRELLGKTQHSLNTADMLRVPFNYPYCSAVALKPTPDGLWMIASQALPILNFSHFSNRFNHHFFAKSG
uniref:Uncharacterized protein n=1 Tax=Panagrolaimus sp. ES5 TaxID=591445 RepID=A0AC34FX47_9BILA